MSEEHELVSGRKTTEISRVSVKHAFVYSVCIGLVAIVIGIFFKSILLSIGLPAVVMGIYIWYVTADAPDLPKSVVGDSFYYLGFVLTLLSLVVSLLNLSLNEIVNMNTIIGSFGAALFTTIIGLIARLYATAFSVETTQRRARLEDELEKSISRFTLQVDTLSNVAISSLTKVHFETEAALKDTLEEYQTITKIISDGFKTTITNGTATVGSSLNTLSVKLNSIEVDKDSITKPLSMALSDLVSVIEKHQSGYHKVNNEFIDSNRLMSEQLSQSNSIISRHISTFETTLLKVVERQSKEYKKSLDEISTTIIDNFDSVKSLKIAAEDGASNELAKLLSGLDNMASEVNGLKNSISSVTKEFNGITGPINESADHLKSSAGSLGEVVSEFNSSLHVSKELASSMKEFDITIKNLQTQLVEIVNSGQSASETMLTAATATEKSSHQVASDIGKIYGHLASQIKSLREA